MDAVRDFCWLADLWSMEGWNFQQQPWFMIHARKSGRVVDGSSLENWRT
jgi:hypothetical protein